MKNKTFQSIIRKKKRIRKKVSGTPEKPRVTICKNLKSLKAQVINDLKGETMVSAMVKNKNCDSARELGKALADKASSQNIKNMVFDRNGYAYHGVVKAFSESLSENGIKV